MFNKFYGEGKVVYKSEELPFPELINDANLIKILTSLGYNVMRQDEKREERLTSKDFLYSDDIELLRARNLGWETQIDVRLNQNCSPQHWMIEVKGNPKKEEEVKKIVDALEVETYKEVKRVTEESVAGSARERLFNWYASLLLEEKIRDK